MVNNWNIPDWLEREIQKRDTACVYCGNEFTSVKISRKSASSWEHIFNDASIITRENIALCCCGCNASKGQKQLSDWLKTKYCQDRGITPETVAPVIKRAIERSL
jgi:5-methylcytosine-specific restriction endonuclease McrA